MTVAELFAAGPIRIPVKSERQDAIKLAIQAPTGMKVLRDELKD
jgi:sRNA-binding carbon storage regulator CsrA